MEQSSYYDDEKGSYGTHALVFGVRQILFSLYIFNIWLDFCIYFSFCAPVFIAD